MRKYITFPSAYTGKLFPNYIKSEGNIINSMLNTPKNTNKPTQSEVQGKSAENYTYHHSNGLNFRNLFPRRFHTYGDSWAMRVASNW
mmetsp:Transcript_5963/g.8345  ORF Transcript_5963/g.8345 Transcript_5963/m.8345 type:complete len:87 (-) Transcript_5963:97-357(-)